MGDVGGQVEPGFESIRDAFGAGHPSEVGGAQLCVYRDGRPMVDIWTGRDVVNDRPYDGDTLTVLMSCTKGAVAICVHRLVERGELDLSSPVARWWPEFARNGKEGVTLARLLTHASGLFGYEVGSGMDGRSALDWDRATAALASMRPYWAPGSAYLYHFITFGFLIGEVVRRATGKTLGRQFAELVAGPLGLDLWIGLPQAEDHRVAPHFRSAPAMTKADVLKTFAALGLDPSDRLIQGLAETMEATEELIEIMTGREGRAVEIPAGNGVGNARALARMYAACIGEVGGVRLLRPETVEAARAPRTDALSGPPPLPPAPPGDAQRFGLGFELPRRLIPMLGKGSFGHPGAGGRIAFADPESGYAVGYACNGMLWDGRNPDPRWVGWMDALREVAGAA
ncbi:MAG TPA: serine hydrolase domain-containing protein [Caulobacteraceae bacterium]|nr:serine hydrolase domain-containing protein [Caulobacteraceae bacterium]